MAQWKRRSRLVSCRLSPEEYAEIEAACIAGRSRSVADFVREAVLNRLSMFSNPQGLLSVDLATLSSELAELNNTLGETREHIARVLGPHRNPSEEPHS